VKYYVKYESFGKEFWWAKINAVERVGNPRKQETNKRMGEGGDWWS